METGSFERGFAIINFQAGPEYQLSSLGWENLPKALIIPNITKALIIKSKHKIATFALSHGI